ncbi:BON domain-containing protein [Hydrogenophaga sp.]|uniref:BON domain-containing protein n=1 Tax=Hydrogenophaga sp. TaxID=1904254 RepID=UPI0025B8CECA|nr:BON domain-containing protein [Hydrogenophaga sp.]
MALAVCGATPTREGKGEHVDESAITTQVKAALLKEPVVSGFVKTGAERSRAAQLASEVIGVQKVKNDILLR